MAAAFGHLFEAQLHLAKVRADYVILERSKFARLRTLWLIVKSLLGISSGKDRFLSVSGDVSTLVSPAKSALLPSRDGRYGALAELFGERTKESSANPLVSIIIPVYNAMPVTMRCLQSIADTWFETLSTEIIVVDDGSSDDTAAVLASIPGITVVRCAINGGFIRACNRGAAVANGRYLVFLNNDTEVRNGWLDHLVNLAERDPLAGVVGSKLIYPDGRLQEAGNIIWRDGHGWNYGRFGDPDDPMYNFEREVDYVSGASLLVRAELFHDLGGFNTDLIPAYYEDTDLCFAVRARGYKVLYQPRSEIVHYEGVSSGVSTLSGTKRFQVMNQVKFEARWRDALKAHLENDPKNVHGAARRLGPQRTILVVDSYVPLHDKESGSLRLLHILKIMRAEGYRVIFMPDNWACIEPYTSELQAMGIEVLHHTDGPLTIDERYRQILPLIDVAWVCRPDLVTRWLPSLREHPRIRVIYDTVDLYWVRLRRQAELEADPDPSKWKASELLELACARAADATITVTAVEKAILEARGIRNVHVVPNIHEVKVAQERSFADSSGVLFIGNYNHPPNVDAATILCRQVMPIVWKQLPDVKLTLLGSAGGPALASLASRRIIVTGYLRDVEPYFLEARVFAAPLRFGAGLKGKIGQSLSYGVPTITTSIGAEGFPMDAGADYILAETAEEFAAAILELYTNEAAWLKMSSNSKHVVSSFLPSTNQPVIAGIIAGLLETARPASSRRAG